MIYSTNSKQEIQNFIKGIKLDKQTSSYRWPNQLKPSLNAWKLWKKIITSTFKITSNYILPINLQLSNWIVSLNDRQIQHKWYFSKESNEIYNRNQQSIHKYFIKNINNNKYEISEDSKERCNKIPNDAIPITHLANQMFQVYTRLSFQNPNQKEPNEFTKYIKILPIWKQVLIKNYKEPSNTEPLIVLIQ